MEPQRMIRSWIFRGGTSKAIVFVRNDLPKDPTLRDKVILRVFGAPDRREIDGLGGADSLTSKLAIIGPSTRDNCDVDYVFGQVSLDEPMIDYSANCGNISSLVGPFAIDEGFVDATEPITVVRINQVNTQKVLIAEVKVRDGRAEVDGDFLIPGVPGSGSEVKLDFSDTAGAKTGALLPTGNVVDQIEIDGESVVEVSIVDAATPGVFVKGSAFGLTCTESPATLDGNRPLMERLERLRSVVAEQLGLCQSWRSATVESPALPLLTLCGPPATYENWATTEAIDENDVDFLARMMFMQRTHKTYAGTGAVCTAAAAMIPGTIVNQMCRAEVPARQVLRIGHPQGSMRCEGRVDFENGEYVLKRATFSRTARCLMQGYALVPQQVFAAEKGV